MTQYVSEALSESCVRGMRLVVLQEGECESTGSRGSGSIRREYTEPHVSYHAYAYSGMRMRRHPLRMLRHPLRMLRRLFDSPRAGL